MATNKPEIRYLPAEEVRMTGRDDIIATLEAALAFLDISVIVRSADAIAEVHGLLTLRQGAEWITLGEEGQNPCSPQD